MNVWLFNGADGLSALTIDGEGANLPAELGPWSKIRPVKLEGNAPDEQEAVALMMRWCREFGRGVKLVST